MTVASTFMLQRIVLLQAWVCVAESLRGEEHCHVLEPLVKESICEMLKLGVPVLHY